MLLKANDQFFGLGISLLKVFVMMLGELEFSNNFIHAKVKEVGGRNFSVQVKL